MVDITFKLGFNGCISICHYVHDIADITSLACLVHQCFGKKNSRGMMAVAKFRLPH